jgi:hypothetical protein
MRIVAIAKHSRKVDVIFNGKKFGKNISNAASPTDEVALILKYKINRMAAKGGPMIIDTKSIPKCDAILGVLRSQPNFIWVQFIDDVSALDSNNKKFPNTLDGYEDAHFYFLNKIKQLAPRALSLIEQQKSRIEEPQSGYESHSKHGNNSYYSLASGKIIKLNRRRVMRKVVVAAKLNIKEVGIAVAAFEATMDEFDSSVALAYNMKQTKTRMPKERIAERVQKHKDRIKQRKTRIKVLEAKKKVANPDQTRLISQRITKQNDKIAKHNEALKYYKYLGGLKPPKVKEQPNNRKPAVSPKK